VAWAGEEDTEALKEDRVLRRLQFH